LIRTGQTLDECGPDSCHVEDIVASPNIGERRGGLRPTILIMHYTGLETVERSIAVLSDPACEVSCHYVVDVDGRIIQMVREADRAWHAGRSYWQGETDINSCSIGIEIQNLGYVEKPDQEWGGPEFPEAQMQAVERLAGDIVRRHDMRPEHVLGHSDIAPQRKIDPGESFDWRRLHRAGIGHWVAPRAIAEPLPRDDRSIPSDVVLTCQQLLQDYGYDVACDGLLTDETKRVISAFQRHFRPACVDGQPDTSTIGTLKDLIAALGNAA
jgi:N-acetylmuramoyl-L-alanine amidase